MGDPTSISVLAGGVGAARMLRGLVAAYPDAAITAIVNVGDDDTVNGLCVSPDIDTILYTLAGQIDPDRGWGLAGESWHAMEALQRYARAVARSDIGWFNLGDRDLGTHLFRTTRRAEGAPLSKITEEMTHAWDLPLTVIPASDDRVATRLRTDLGDLSFQEYFVREHHELTVSEVRFDGADQARPAPGVIESLRNADVIVIAPSNPIISIGPVLAVPGIREVVEARRGDTVAVSPIVGGKALKGPADRLLSELGHEPSARAVAGIYRSLCGGFVVDLVDREALVPIESLGMRCIACPTVMIDLDVSAALARHAVGLATDHNPDEHGWGS